MPICPFSGELFPSKRKNQVFASAKNRRDFHNQRAAELRRIQSPINRHLEKNIRIVSELVKPGEQKTFVKSDLTKKGYNTSYFTHLDSLNGVNYMCLYQYFIKPSSNNELLTFIYPTKND
jgi:hypothetical protein